jgi:hypothetical protein
VGAGPPGPLRAVASSLISLFASASSFRAFGWSGRRVLVTDSYSGAKSTPAGQTSERASTKAAAGPRG